MVMRMLTVMVAVAVVMVALLLMHLKVCARLESLVFYGLYVCRIVSTLGFARVVCVFIACIAWLCSCLALLFLDAR